jgi:hypothetical protein
MLLSIPVRIQLSQNIPSPFIYIQWQWDTTAGNTSLSSNMVTRLMGRCVCRWLSYITFISTQFWLELSEQLFQSQHNHFTGTEYKNAACDFICDLVEDKFQNQKVALRVWRLIIQKWPLFYGDRILFRHARRRNTCQIALVRYEA